MKERAKDRIQKGWIINVGTTLGFLIGVGLGCSNDAGFSGSSTEGRRGELPPAREFRKDPNGGSGSDATGQPGSKGPSDPDDSETLPSAFRIEREFKVADLLEEEARLAVSRGLLTRDVTLGFEREGRNLKFQQVERPLITRMYKQGHPGSMRSEMFTQENFGVLDLLVVVDNSNSMQEEQANLSARLEPLMQYVVDSDWRINVVTTDPRNGCSRAVIRKGDPNPETSFRNAVMAGTGGDGNEQGVRMAVEGLRCPQAQWLRPNSSIGILIVSDEDNCSINGTGCRAPYNSPDYLLNYLKNDLKRSLGKDARVYGIFWKPGMECATGYNEARQYYSLVEQTGGKWGSICDADYSGTLRAISEDVATILKRDFQLISVPDVGSLIVKVNGVLWTDGYNVRGNVLQFNRKPPYGATIEVAYETGSMPILTRFPLGDRPAAPSLKVTMNGQELSKDAYSLDGQTGEVVFATPPPHDADLVFSFRRDDPLMTRFPLDAGALNSTLAIKVGGTELSSGFRVDGSGVLVFDQPPLDGATVEVSYQVRTHPILEYPLGSLGPDYQLLGVFDGENGQKVDATLDGTKLVINPAEHREGRRLVVKCVGPRLGRLEVPLSRGYLPDSVRISVDQGTCSQSLSGNTLLLDCDVSGDATVQVVWKHYSDPKAEFLMSDVPDPEQGLWSVSVDGQATLAFERQGRIIRVTEALDPASTVTVRFDPSF